MKTWQSCTWKTCTWRAAALLAVALFGAPALAMGSHPGDDWCRDNDDDDRHCEVRELAMPLLDLLRIDAGDNGSIDVRAGDGEQIRVLAKVEAWDRDGDPGALARQVQIER